MADSNVSRKSRESDCTLLNILYLVCVSKVSPWQTTVRFIIRTVTLIRVFGGHGKWLLNSYVHFGQEEALYDSFFSPFFFAFKSLSCLWANRCGGPNYASSYSCSGYSDLSRVISNTTKNGKFQVSRVLPDIFSFPSIQSKHENVHWYQSCSSSWLTEDGSPASTVRNCPLCLSSAHQP